MRVWIVFGAAVVSLFLLSGCGEEPKPKPFKATAHTSAARHKATMRCYTVLGKKYQPTYVEVGQKMRGIASWYGPNFHGKYTSNGERYNMYAKTAAHKTWPMDTLVRVKNLQNGKSTVVRINDRGPFVKGRIIDCSYAAGKELGLDKSGIAKVEIEVVGFATKGYKAKKPKPKRSPKRVLMKNFGIQLAAFSSKARAQAYVKKYASKYENDRLHVVIKRFTKPNGKAVYRVWLMGFDTERAAKEFKRCRGIDGPIVRN